MDDKIAAIIGLIIIIIVGIIALKPEQALDLAKFGIVSIGSLVTGYRIGKA